MPLPLIIQREPGLPRLLFLAGAGGFAPDHRGRKRGLTGAFHKISLNHLQRYLDEFSFRFNNEKSPDLFGMTVRRMALAGNLPYAKLVEEKTFTPFIRRDK
jgi:hypothetical protein